MKRSVGIPALCVAIALLVPAPASALIQVDRGIAGVRLGNSKAEVRAALGKPARVINGTNPFGKFTEFRYRGKIRVLFQGRKSVTAVSTAGLGDRTVHGVGVRSTGRAVRKRVRGITCERPFEGVRSCHTGTFDPGTRVTDFLVRKGRVIRVTVAFVID